MTGIFGRFRGQKEGSGAKAKERLQLILVHDRINLPPQRLEEMKREILAVISKYVSVDNQNVEIALHQRDRNNLLVAEIPFEQTNEPPKLYPDESEGAASRLKLDDDDDEAAEDKDDTKEN